MYRHNYSPTLDFIGQLGHAVSFGSSSTSSICRGMISGNSSIPRASFLGFVPAANALVALLEVVVFHEFVEVGLDLIDILVPGDINKRAWESMYHARLGKACLEKAGRAIL